MLLGFVHPVPFPEKSRSIHRRWNKAHKASSALTSKENPKTTWSLGAIIHPQSITRGTCPSGSAQVTLLGYREKKRAIWGAERRKNEMDKEKSVMGSEQLRK